MHEVGHRSLLHLLVVVLVLQVHRMIASVLHHLVHLVELVVKEGCDKGSSSFRLKPGWAGIVLALVSGVDGAGTPCSSVPKAEIIQSPSPTAP